MFRVYVAAVALLLSAAFELLLLSHSSMAQAGTRIDNVVMLVDPSGRAVTDVTNIGDTPIGYVLTALRWSVVDGEDVLEPTNEFMAVPPSFQLQPGETRTVRVGFRNPTPSRLERTFRLSVREVPPVIEGEGIALAYDHRLPVFIAPQGGAEPRNIRWSISGGELRAENLSNSRAGILGVELMRDGEPMAVVETRARAMILAQTWRSYPLPISVGSGDQVELRVRYMGRGVEDIVLTAD